MRVIRTRRTWYAMPRLFWVVAIVMLLSVPFILW